MEKIYFIGINGIGMSGLAKIMKCKGYEVKGADICRNYVTEELLSMGIKVYDEHDEKNVKGVDFVVASTAIGEKNPEYKYSKENDIKILKRGELLAKLLNRETGIAVAGTHGKTTTTSMLAASMLSKDPTIVVGGILPEIKSNAKPGKGEYFIAEADESDNSFLYMKPKYSIITNIEADHLDVHKNLDNIKKSFIQFISHTQEEAIVCIDCPNVNAVISDLPAGNRVITYSKKNKKANIYAENIRIEDRSTIFEVVINGESKGEYILNVPGEHNVQNVLPVIYLSLKFGVEKALLNESLKNFKGSKRRYDVLYDDILENGFGNKTKRVRIIDDYAHHPTEIKATLAAIKSIDKSRLVAIFQPHRYSRVHFLIKEFKDAFKLVDKVILLPIYAAGEKNEFNISSEVLKESIEHDNIEVMENWKDIKKYVSRVKKDSTYIFMGAGDISTLAHEISEDLESLNSETFV
ncbi:UDP-N-acetylmuramate--L-alanine ligase [Fusobacterium russii]|uniref:UDP-N-acetylmuramate--L-alanine ligase n=1 Tax=Fusobacterium russii TaxID=854 RepID=UPI0003A1EE7F|nr:UDP-N-acetylmuramate--L-alanine ligase [Fusobacterium russii]